MRAWLVVVLAGCTLGGGGPGPVAPRPQPSAERMPSAVLDKQDPGADTSKNPVLSRTSASYVDRDDAGRDRWLGCLRMMSCSSVGRGDASGVAIVLAVLAATRRRRNTS